MREKEFGSNFCEELSKCNRRLDNNDRVLFFDSGRSAIRYLLDYLGKEIKRVMLPQYICESVIMPFAERGCEIVFYPINKRFELCREDFIKLAEYRSPQLILVQTYFGFDTLNKERSFLKELSGQGIIVVEDVTHNIFSNNWKWCADFTIGSIRKWCSIPDGGFLFGKKKWRKINSINQLNIPENKKFVDKRIEAQRKKREYNTGRILEKEEFISLFGESEEILYEQKEYYGMSLFSKERIWSVNWNEVICKRSQNYRILRDILEGTINIEFPYSEVDSQVPLYFPVFIKGNKRDKLRDAMRKKDIFLPIIWPVSSILAGKLTKEVQEIYDTILAIPCDQRYTQRDMITVASAILQEMG